LKAKPFVPNGFGCFLDKEVIFFGRKICGYKLNNKAKNVSRICIKLCAAGIFGCRIRICSI